MIPGVDAPLPSPPSARPPRRPRYRGTHPRRFEEKYKEHNPDKYPDAVRSVIESGRTPAGSHRPICVEEILAILAPRAGETAVDATLGFGGHAQALLPTLLPGGRLIALDVDPVEFPKAEARLRGGELPAEALTVCHRNFAGLPRVLTTLGVSGVDMVLADLGCSSMQFDDPARGFSFKHDGPLDLRMNPHKGQPASAFLARADEARLTRVLAENADEPHAAHLARALTQAGTRGRLTTTRALRETVCAALRTLPSGQAQPSEEACLRRVFQALRIEINDEFSALETFLRFLPGCLNPGARVAILAFHSGEDRRVKKSFAEGNRSGLYARIAEEVIRPSVEERRANPRSSSAKLRWAVRA